jgi:hypothetical protein
MFSLGDDRVAALPASDEPHQCGERADDDEHSDESDQ